jgi:triacylglycerol lipase
MSTDPIPMRPGTRTLLCALAAASAAMASPLPAGATTPDYTRNPILFVHGYFVIDDAGPATWATFKQKALDEGWPESYIRTPSFQDVRGCNADHVNEIEAWVEELRSATGFDKVDIVCHSFGCLNVMTWMKERCGVNRVRQFVSMAGAFHGTTVACVEPFSCAAGQMCIAGGTDGWKTNELLAAVNACDETPGDVEYTAVWTPTDEIIQPPTGSRLAGADTFEVQTIGVGHGKIFLCDECWLYVSLALTEGGGNDDGPGWDCLPACAPAPEPQPESRPEPQPDLVPEPLPDPGVPDVPAATDGTVETATDAPATDTAATDRVEADVPAVDAAADATAPADTAPDAAGEDVPLPPRKSGGCSAAF